MAMEHTAELLLDFGPDGQALLPVVTQDARTREVLILAFANRDAFEETRRSGLATYWSRSRNELWHKGATSGNLMRVREIHADCDADTLLLKVDPAGPACHTGEYSCFYRKIG